MISFWEKNSIFLKNCLENNGLQQQQNENNNNSDLAEGKGKQAAEMPKSRMLREKGGTLMLELDKQRVVVGQRLSIGSVANTLSGQSSPSSGARDVHVRTPLNDPTSPWLVKASYSAYEPDKQQLIREEIGSNGPDRIRRIVDHFQNAMVWQNDHEKKQREATNGGGIEAKENPQMPQRKFGVESEVRVESQRPVADILSQFQRERYTHANGKSSAMAAAAASSVNGAAGKEQQRPSTLDRQLGSHSIWSTTRIGE